MSAVQILCQMPGITELPLHQISILNDVLCGDVSTNPTDLIIPIPKDDSFELVRMSCSVKVDWDKDKNTLAEFDAAVEKFIGRTINRHESTRYIVDKDEIKNIPIIIFYKNVEGYLTCMESYVKSQKVKRTIELFQAYYLYPQSWKEKIKEVSINIQG